MESTSPTGLQTERPPAPPEVHPAKRPSSSRLGRWLFLAALAGAAAYYYYGPRLKPPQPAASAPARAGFRRGPGIIPVVTAKAQRGNIGVYFNGLGVVTPIYTVTVKSRVDGQLMQVLYTEGQPVRAGDLLVEIDPRPFEVQLTQAQGQLMRDQALLANARVDLARYQTLLKQNAIPEQQLATQQALVAQYEGAVKADQGQVDSARLNLVYCRITSPITGRVGLRLVDPGNIVHANDANGLLVITQVDPISVIFTIAEDQLPAVREKLRAGRKLRVDAYDREMKNRLAQGVLQTLDNQIDQTTATLRLRAMFDNKNDALFPNQFVNARLLVEEKSGVTLVPNGAIQRNSQATYVWLVKPDQTVAVRTVTVGTVEADQAEILSGVAPGDVLVTDGVDKLQEGSKVSTRANTEGGARGAARAKGDRPRKNPQ
ncbi:MAG TPA: MdtA/MuxA family multidrug efflux RND transporter periplasmic adaptor subunit [Bryobacteraceae bacterium]|nr:MdtA/MuxA family multidrug efflux RND transporter periplasmic adaptor subunit [Bryobacteraceae bacterium]